MNTSSINMLDSTDTRTQPWKTWYAPLPKEAPTGQLMLLGNNGNDNSDRNVFGTSTPATSAAKQQITFQLSGHAAGN